MPKLILDTDIGTDVDDVCALGLALASPEVELLAVTTVFDDVAVRSRIASRVLEIAGRADVPVGIGHSQTLLRNRPFHWAGWEGEAMLRSEDEGTSPWVGPAVDLIVDLARAHPGEITLVPIGPLTNVAAAIVREPKLPELLAGIVLMGGVVRYGESLSNSWAEWNIRCDPEAAALVFRSASSITMVGLDVTKQVKMRRSDLPRLHEARTPLGQLVADQLDLHMHHHTHRDHALLHDPLAVGMAIDPTFCRTAPLYVQVETRGEFTSGVTVAVAPTEAHPANALACVEVDGPRFERFFVERIAGAAS
jgi:purine nucleosidase